MTRTDKLMAMEALWMDLSRNDSKLESPPWHADVLKNTETLVKAGKVKPVDWDKAKASLRRKMTKLA